MQNTPTPSAGALPKALAGLVALAVAMGIGRFAFTPVLPMMQRDFGLSIAAGGLLASANYVGYLIGALSAIAWKIRPEIAVRSGLIAIAFGTLAMAVRMPFEGWLLLRILAGVASAWVLISVSAWCMEALAAYRRPFLSSLVFAGVGIGITVAGLVCLLLSQAGLHSRTAWGALGAIAAAASVLVWRIFEPRDATAPASEMKPKRFRWNAQALRLISCYGIFGFGYIIPATFLPVMARDALQGSMMFGLSWPVFGMAAALSTLCVAALVRSIGNRMLWLLSHLVMALGVVLPGLWPNLATVFAAALCVGGTFMVITLAAMQEGKRIAGEHARLLIAAMTAAFATGQIIGPLIVSGRAFSSALVLAGCLLAASTLLLIPHSSRMEP